MIHWGLLGCGDISNKRVAPAIIGQKDSILAAVADSSPTQLSAFIERNKVERAYSSLEEMLRTPELDAVYIATPIFLHHAQALDALRAGKHVLLEKPMAMTNAQCEELIAEADRQGVKFGVSYFRRFFPKFEEAKRIIGDGMIGQVISARITFHSNYNPSKDDPKRWRVEKAKAGGGPLYDMGCHKIDMLIDILGSPKSVSALMSTQTHDYEVEDSCSALMELESGAHCTATFNWNAEVWHDEFVILGTKGRISMLPCDGDPLILEYPPRALSGMGSEVTTILKPCAANVHAPLVDDFARAIIEDRAPRITGEEGYKTNRVLAAIEESARSGAKIPL